MDHVFEDDEHKAQAQREVAQEAERRFCNAIVSLASTPDGLLFLRWVIDTSQILRAYTSPPDPAQAAYSEGKRHIGAQLIALARKAGVLPEILKEESNAH